jgi:hypothetical protein
MTFAPQHAAWWFALAIALAPSLRAAQSVHLLGFVDKPCPTEPYCFELLVKADFVAELGERIMVRFDENTTIYNPENYQLTLEQHDIVAGSHLRMLIEADSNSQPGDYRASVIWIGD